MATAPVWGKGMNYPGRFVAAGKWRGWRQIGGVRGAQIFCIWWGLDHISPASLVIFFLRRYALLSWRSLSETPPVHDKKVNLPSRDAYSRSGSSFCCYSALTVRSSNWPPRNVTSSISAQSAKGQRSGSKGASGAESRSDKLVQALPNCAIRDLRLGTACIA